MVGKKSGRALLREEGLQRTDNNLEFTTWPQVNMINQKNYYTEFLKRDDQILALRLQQDERLDRRKKAAVDIDRARALAGPDTSTAYADADPDLDEDVTMDDPSNENYGAKTIVIHIGSQNLRLGLASDVLPKTVPMVIARKSRTTESEDGEPLPKRLKLSKDAPSETWFGVEFAKEYNSMAAEFRTTRRQYKRRVLPNSRDLVTKWNSTNPPELISEHNDPLRIEWTELPTGDKAPDYIVGAAALRLPEKTSPKYHLYWPVRYGWLNERDYQNRSLLYHDFFRIIEESIKTELGLTHSKEWSQYSCVFVIPDLYEKAFVYKVLDEFIREFSFQRVCFIQESLAASFGGGFSTACVVDIGAQKTSVCCVEDGMCGEDARVNLKYGGYDVTETFVKMMLFDKFNYSDLNLLRRHDFLLAEELKEQHATMSDENISVQLFEFHLRAYGQETRRYQFKIYDEGMLAPMGFFRPTIFDHSEKLNGRHSLIPPSVDLYSGHRNDPISQAQRAVVQYVEKNIAAAIMAPAAKPVRSLGTPMIANGTPLKQKLLSQLGGDTADGTPRSSVAGSPPPEENDTPAPQNDGADGDGYGQVLGAQPDQELLDRVVPVMPLEQAILTSINYASGNDERKRRDFLGSIMLIGGGAKTPHLGTYLEGRLRAALPQYPKEILVAPPPRDLDPAVIVWKGASVFGKLRMTNDSWITPLEYDRLGSRILNYKCMWHWS